MKRTTEFSRQAVLNLVMKDTGGGVMALALCNPDGSNILERVVSQADYAHDFVDADVHVVNNTIGEVGHGFSDGDIIIFTTTGTLPVGLALATNFYVVNSAADTYKVSLTKRGSVVDITGALGGGIHTATLQPAVSINSVAVAVMGAMNAKNGFATELWDIAGGHFESAVVNTEYYSPNQCGGIYGVIYRQYFNTLLTSTNPRLDTGSRVTKMVDFVLHTKYTGNDRGVAHGNMTAYGSSDDHAYIMLSGASGGGDLSLAVTGYSIITGWIDYTK